MLTNFIDHRKLPFSKLRCALSKFLVLAGHFGSKDGTGTPSQGTSDPHDEKDKRTSIERDCHVLLRSFAFRVAHTNDGKALKQIKLPVRPTFGTLQ